VGYVNMLGQIGRICDITLGNTEFLTVKKKKKKKKKKIKIKYFFYIIKKKKKKLKNWYLKLEKKFILKIKKKPETQQ
jgi:hypothetical protein